MKISREVGEDSEDAWNDRHFQHVYLWLTTNPNSPYFGAPSVLMAALKVAIEYRQDMKKAMRLADFRHYRFSVRVGLTYKMKMVLAGLYEPKIIKRDRKGIVRRFEILPAANPKPIPCPPFYRGSIKLTTKGLKVMLRQSDAVMAPMHNPEGMERLTNPWGKLRGSS